MTISLGTDLVKISRLRRLALKMPRLVDRLFTPGERTYCHSRKNPWPHFAVRYAAKEALVKACGGFLAPYEMEIFVRKTGKPYFRFSGKTRNLLKRRGMVRCHISLTHEGDYAMAFVSLEK